MKSLLTLAVLLSVCFTVSAQDTTKKFVPCEYAGLEFYGNAGDLFIYAGKDLSEYVKIDAWGTNAWEIAFTVGPKIGPVNIGIGTSFGNVNGVNKLKYINADLGFYWEIGSVNWSSYNLFQQPLEKMNQFILLRQFVSMDDCPVGLIGHNVKIGADKWKLFWGPYWNFGKITAFKSVKFGLAVDLNNTKAFWGLLRLEL